MLLPGRHAVILFEIPYCWAQGVVWSFAQPLLTFVKRAYFSSCSKMRQAECTKVDLLPSNVYNEQLTK